MKPGDKIAEVSTIEFKLIQFQIRCLSNASVEINALNDSGFLRYVLMSSFYISV